MGSCEYSQFDEKTEGDNEKSFLSYHFVLRSIQEASIIRSSRSKINRHKESVNSSTFKVLLCKLLQKVRNHGYFKTELINRQVNCREQNKRHRKMIQPLSSEVHITQITQQVNAQSLDVKGRKATCNTRMYVRLAANTLT